MLCGVCSVSRTWRVRWSRTRPWALSTTRRPCVTSVEMYVFSQNYTPLLSSRLFVSPAIFTSLSRSFAFPFSFLFCQLSLLFRWNPLIQAPMGQKKVINEVSLLERCPHLNGVLRERFNCSQILLILPPSLAPLSLHLSTDAEGKRGHKRHDILRRVQPVRPPGLLRPPHHPQRSLALQNLLHRRTRHPLHTLSQQRWGPQESQVTIT